MPISSPNPDLATLVALFFADPALLGQLTLVAPDQVPDAYRRLLVHEEHMTVAMEAFHESLVDVDVLDIKESETYYARKILLKRRTDGATVQFGIMRVNLTLLDDDVRGEIRQQRRPLGRILVRHNLMRTVHLSELWKVMPGIELQRHFEIGSTEQTYGRTAAIALHDVPAVEVLEIVAPSVLN